MNELQFNKLLKFNCTELLKNEIITCLMRLFFLQKAEIKNAAAADYGRLSKTN